MKKILIFCLFVVSLTFLSLAGCKVEVTIPEGGKVITESGSHECLSGQVCSIDIYDIYFDETFIAVPEAGYTFLAWRKKHKGLCGGKAKPCRLSTTGFPGNDVLMAILESDDIFYLEPLFLSEGKTAILSGHYGSSNDTYAREAIDRNTEVLDPHQWDKACPLSPWANESDFYAVTEIEWWGYYASGNLPANNDNLDFKIVFYANASEIVATRRFSAKPVPSPSVVSPWYSSPYAGQIIYGYKKKFGIPLQITRGDVFYSIVQLDNETGESDSNFIWHGDYASPGRANMRFLTDYGGWILGAVSDCRAVMTGYHSGGYSRP